MENYKEKYTKALERANAKIETYNRLGNASVVKSICDIFPELKESENEKIRKELIRAFTVTADKKSHEIYGNGITYGQVLAWLEKQGEHANFRNKIQIGDKVTRNEDGVLVNLSQLNRVAEPAEKQRKRKPTDKVEPKFKVGDKIKLAEEPKYPAREIIAIKNDAYCFDKLEQLPFINQDKWELVEQTPADKIKQNPTWNEEDEMMLETVLDKIGDLGTGEMCKEWLKSIKERMKGE